MSLHHPIQCRHPDWTATGDFDPDLARATRRALLDEAVRRRALILGTHFAGTGAGVVSADGDMFRFQPQPVF